MKSMSESYIYFENYLIPPNKFSDYSQCFSTFYYILRSAAITDVKIAFIFC